MPTVNYAEYNIRAPDAECCYAECCYAECRYGECRGTLQNVACRTQNNDGKSLKAARFVQDILFKVQLQQLNVFHSIIKNILNSVYE